MNRTLRIAIFAATVLCGSSLALAQYPMRYTPPGGSPFSNALNYFRRDVGVLDPYNAFIEPRRQLDRRIQQLNYQQQADYQASQRELSQIRQSQAAPTGTGATFMNYSHYYPQPVGGARRTR